MWTNGKCHGSLTCNSPFPLAGTKTYRTFGTCHDLDWTSRTGESCLDYKTKGWCKAGTYGPQWGANYGEFSKYEDSNGVDASQACCECSALLLTDSKATDEETSFPSWVSTIIIAVCIFCGVCLCFGCCLALAYS